MKGGLGATPGIAQDSGSQSSTTKSGVSGGEMTLTGQSQVSTSLDQSVVIDKDSSSALTKNWNGQQLMDQTQAGLQITSTALPRVAQEIGTQMDRTAAELRKQGNETEAKKYDEGGAYRIAAHTTLGALGSRVSGALGAGAATVAAPTLNDLQGALQSKLTAAGVDYTSAKAAAQLIIGGAAATIGGVAGGGAGAVTAFNADANNRQLHWSQFVKDKARCDKTAQASGCATIEKMAGVKSQVLDFMATETANVAVNTDASGRVVSYTLLDKATNEPVLIMEPVDFQTFRSAPPATKR